MSETLSRIKRTGYNLLAILLCLFVLIVVNFDALEGLLLSKCGFQIPKWLSQFVPSDDQPKLAMFGMLGVSLVFLGFPTIKRFEKNTALQILDLVLVACTVVTFGYIFVQSESLFERNDP